MNSWRTRLFSVLLRAYPREFREHYAASMADHAAAEERESFGRTVLDVITGSLAMRFEDLWRDLVYAVRTNAKAPLFTLVIVATIALAIATNTVVFALLNAVLLKPLPFADAAQIGVVWETAQRGNGQTFNSLGNKQADAITGASKAFAAATYAMSTETVSLSGGATAHRVSVKNNYFSVLGVQPVLGTFLSDAPPARQAVISSALWHSRYGGDASVLGKPIELSGTQYTIVGVAPPDMLDPSLGGLSHNDVWTKVPVLSGDTEYGVFPIVRLRNGVTW